MNHSARRSWGALFALISPVGLAACGSSLVNTKLPGEDTGTVEGIPNASVETPVVDFGQVVLGVSAPATLNLSNVGTGALTVIELRFSGAEFSASGGAGITVSPGASTGLALRYLPIDYVDDTGTLTIVTDDPDEPEIVVSLRGGVVVDADADGFDSRDAGGDDCDDEDPAVYPGAFDEWYDGKDANCDGADDYDQDEDGFQTWVVNPDASSGGGDCQDANPDMNPAQADTWYDGVDTNCDGIDDYDKDGDGFGSLLHGAGDDCDDEDPAVNPDATEVFNAVDDDCDEGIDTEINAYDANYVYYGVTTGDGAGYQMTVGDVDGDGEDDLVVGNPAMLTTSGAVSIFISGRLPSSGSDMQDAFTYIPGSTSERLGQDVSVFESSGSDAQSYLLIAAPTAVSAYGRIYVMNGYDALAGAPLSSASLLIEGTGGANGYWVGRGMSQGLDLNADGIEDLMGWYQSTNSTNFVPNLFLVYGDRWETGATTTITLAASDARWSTDGGGTGTSVPFTPNQDHNFSGGADIDGDGYDDFVHCDQNSDVTLTNDGAVWVIWGQAAKYSNGSATDIEGDGDAVATGGQYQRMGWICSPGGDMDGDGDLEFWAYNEGLGQLVAFPGGIDRRSGALVEDEEALAVYNFGTGAPPAKSLRRIGDWDGDGEHEVAFGLSAGTDGGALYVLSSGTFGGALDPDEDAMAVLQGQADADLGLYQVNFGGTIAKVPGDMNNDGQIDLVVADPAFGNSASAPNKGAVYIHLRE